MRILAALDSKSPYYFDIFELLKTSSSINNTSNSGGNITNEKLQEMLNTYLDNKTLGTNTSGIQQDQEYDYKIAHVDKIPDLRFKEDKTNTLITYIGDEKILEVLGEVRIDILREINSKIDDFLKKITFDLTQITRADVLELKREIYNLMSINEEPVLVS